jgi:ABC-2 type transport system permease protein
VKAPADRKVPGGLRLVVLGIAAICQRAYLTLWRQPVLIVSTMLFPLVYLLVLGNALNRQLRHIPLAVVDEADNASSSACRRGVMALATGRELVTVVFVADRDVAVRDLRRGRYRGVWILPFRLAPKGPPPAFIGDNTERFSSEALESALSGVWEDVSRGREADRFVPAVRLDAYPYLDYLTYLGPAVVCLSIFMGSMVSGGLQVIEDRMFGYHEGYLVTPISTGTLVAGHILAGAVVASLAGLLVLAAILIATPGGAASTEAVAAAVVTVFLTALAIASAWFLLFARARHASVLRGMFGIINTLLFFPSGALYPVESYPPWLRAVSNVDPLTYGVEGLRDLLLRGAPASTAFPGWIFLATFTLVCGVLTKVLFRREV